MIYFSNNNLKDILILLVFTIISFILFVLVGQIFSYLLLDNYFPGVDVQDLLFVEQLKLFRINQPLNTIGLFLAPALVYKYFYKKELLFSKNTISIKSLFLVSALSVIILPIISVFANLNQLISLDFLGEVGISIINNADKLLAMVNKYATADTVAILMLNIFIFAILPAVAEEFFFRGIIQNLLIKSTGNTISSIVLTSAIFSLAHLNIKTIIPIFLLGIVLGFIYNYYKNIWVAVAFHFTNNSIMIFSLYAFTPTNI